MNFIESAGTKLKPIIDVEWTAEEAWFDKSRVYVDEATGCLFYATDSGSAYGVPFAGTTPADLHPLSTLQDWEDHAASRVTEDDPNSEYETPKSAVDASNTARNMIASALSQGI